MKELLPFTILYEEDGLGPISRLTFSSNGLLAIASRGAEVWDFSGQDVPDEPIAFFPGTCMLPPIAWSLDNSRLAVGQKERVAVYCIATQEEVSVHAHNGDVTIIAWSPDGASLASCSRYGQYHFWQPETGILLQSRAIGLSPSFLLWLPDGRIITNPATATSSQWQVQLWNSRQTEVEHVLDDGERRCDNFSCAAFARGSISLALGTEEGFIQVWHIEAGTKPTRDHVFPFHMNAITGLAWSPNETYLASGSKDGHVAIWNERGEILYHAGYRPSGDMGIRDLVWWKDLLAVAYDGGHVALYRVPEIGGSHE